MKTSTNLQAKSSQYVNRYLEQKMGLVFFATVTRVFPDGYVDRCFLTGSRCFLEGDWCFLRQ